MGKLNFVYKIFLTGLICTSAFVFSAKSQNTVIHTNMLWLSYNNTYEINKKFSVVSDALLRTRDYFSKWSQMAVRSGVSYAAGKRFSLAVGFAWFKNVQYVGTDPLFKNEYRPWQDIVYKAKLFNKKAILTERLRNEERFQQAVINNKLSSHYDFVDRLRYRIELMFPLHDTAWAVGGGNEVMINPRYIKGPRFFDQDRIFFSVNRNLSPSVFLQTSLMEVIQQKGKATVFEDQNVLRISLFQRINYRKKTLPAKPNYGKHDE